MHAETARPEAGPGLLVYDGGCGFCTRAAGWAHRLDATAVVRPWQELDLARLGLTETEVTAAAWYVDEVDGRLRRRRGHQAIAAVLASSSRRTVRVLGRVLSTRAMSGPGRAAYAVVARIRHRLPGGTATCRLPRR
ncbi:MAG: DCC1-like thiol-disulfide oxidoreductase family protein [Nocardioides sp.]|uniref:thiol-disulfide oxidoreductase DCC family protein n=1 Tax=Nocardioides sp. TaxID=35761 RepID=UPI0039E33FC4